MGLSKETAALIGMLGGPALGGLFGGFANNGQERKSFEGTAADPVNMISEMHDLLTKTGRGLTDRVATPISLPSAYVQQPGAFSGGGLPMPIGLNASDPALTNPSLINKQGLGEFQDLFASLGGGSPSPRVPPGWTPPDPVDPGALPPVDPGDGNSPGNGATPGTPLLARGATSDTGIGMPSRPKLIRGADLLNEDHGDDDLHRAAGAAQLLLHALGMDGGDGLSA